MMTSVGTNRARGSWEQTQTQNQAQHKQRPQATAEQIRLAQMISDHNDADFEEKVKQLIDITGKNQDECVIALHDCNGDVNRAINVLLEGNPDTHSWEMVGKKKGVSGQKDSGQTEPSEEGKENRERERDFSRRRGGLPRRGRGASRGREFRGQENGLDGGKAGGSSGRGTERGRRGRGRGRGGSGRRGGRFSAQGMGTFNPADYAEPASTEEGYGNSNNNTWNNTGSFEPDDGTSKWPGLRGGGGSSFREGADDVPSLLSQWDLHLKNPSDSAVHSPFAKRQAFPPTSAMMDVFLQDKPPVVTASVTAPAPPSSPLASKTNPVPQMSPGSSDNQSSSPQPAQQKLKQQKKKASLTSKIPALAVEMPGSADISGLNLQFGALQFGSEPVLSEYEPAPATSASVSQPPSSLYTSTASESLSTISSNKAQESGYQSSTMPTATYTSQNSAQGPLYEQRSTQTRRYPNSLSSSPQKDLTQAKNGFSSVPPTQLQTTQTAEGSTGPAVKSDSPSAPSITAPLNDTVSAASLLTTATQHSSVLSSLNHAEELPSTATTQHSSTLPTQQNSLSSSTSSGRTSTSTLLHTSVESEAGLHSSASTFSTSSSTVSAAPPVVSAPSSLSSVSSLGLSSNSTVTATTRSSVATTSGKAPPNLPPGVPPLLPNPYIMAPGLLPAYPTKHLQLPVLIGHGFQTFYYFGSPSLDTFQLVQYPSYSNSRTHVLTMTWVFHRQARFPLDYYSIPFPTPTTPLSGRDASLSSNPYSGDLPNSLWPASLPAPATTLGATQQNRHEASHTTQQGLPEPALPGYSFTSLPCPRAGHGAPCTFGMGPARVPMSGEATLVRLPLLSSWRASIGDRQPRPPFQQPSGYGSHGYSTGVSVTSSNTGVPDISGSVYSKTQQSFEKQGVSTPGTYRPRSNLRACELAWRPHQPNPAARPTATPSRFMHIPGLSISSSTFSRSLHHHLQQGPGGVAFLQSILYFQRQQEDQSTTGQRSQGSSIPQKSQANKSAYNSYNWGAN
ncbi:LOW QUALITY PROTEIN: ubiquitin-associated protein 2-like [Sphaerodactylus townsendi]|uniref:LOW QUALITY PROTEIN: ubiquitin-associated protein 2-like n=1 Tax=Sphaerodactylus townsendi TaxID=933632 RepID=UPI002026374A|nr:LOW QUALITY PROTEIN: ubiquitin-associated protein 2-like [Sphaerodactylus townsendi]